MLSIMMEMNNFCDVSFKMASSDNFGTRCNQISMSIFKI